MIPALPNRNITVKVTYPQRAPNGRWWWGLAFTITARTWILRVSTKLGGSFFLRRAPEHVITFGAAKHVASAV